MSGPLALLGGLEHNPGCEDADRRLLGVRGRSRPVVALLLAASPPGRRQAKAAEARRYYARLGAEVRCAFTGLPDEEAHALGVLEDPDLVLLGGGRPWLLHQRLDATPVLDRVMALWRAGVPLMGSSAGAMALCQWRPVLRGPRPLQLVPGFGLVPSAVVVPHFGRHGMERWAGSAARRYPSLSLLGLADRTALVLDERGWRVAGAAPVTLLRGARRRLLHPGDLHDPTVLWPDPDRAHSIVEPVVTGAPLPR